MPENDPPGDGWLIRPIRPPDYRGACELVRSLFDEFVAPDLSSEGRAKFLATVTPAALRDRVDAGHEYAVASRAGQLVGVVGLHDGRHLYWLFVAERCHRQGIGRRLLAQVVEPARQRRPRVPQITVNSSPYAVAAYRRLGFAATGPELIREGIRMTPMVLDPDAFTG